MPHGFLFRHVSASTFDSGAAAVLRSGGPADRHSGAPNLPPPYRRAGASRSRTVHTIDMQNASDEPTSLCGFFDQYQVETSVGYLLARTRAKLAKTLDVALVPFDITHAQGSIVLMLATGRYSTATELARELYIDAASMTRMIDRLEKRCLIRRERTRDDRRVILLKLTDSGRELGERLPPVYGDVVRRSFTGFSEEEIVSLRALLRKALSVEVPPAPTPAPTLPKTPE
jgi:DNA-binding MarR family transcriptional regulator